MASKYQPVSLNAAAKDALNRAKLTASAAVGRQLTFSELVIALCDLATEHAQELTARLTPKEGTDS